MPIQRINQFPEASGANLTSDDVFIFMDDPAGSAVTKKVSLSELSSVLGGGGGGPTASVIQLGNVSGVINTDASAGNIFDMTLMSSGTLANPSNSTDGQSIRWRITHNANSIPLSLGSNFRIPSTASNPLPFSTASGVTDLLAATYDQDRNKWDVIAFIPGY